MANEGRVKRAEERVTSKKEVKGKASIKN